MKIGIVTFYEARNYGAVLQAYALQTYLIKIGHDPFFINYQCEWEEPFRGIRGWLARSPTGILQKLNMRMRSKAFKIFRNKYLHIDSHRYKNFEEIKGFPPFADVYICGSDQIWNPKYISGKGDESFYWLDFGNNNVRRIAYAVSFGVDSLKRSLQMRWTKYAKNINEISVREKNGINLVNTLGRTTAVWVPDPTLLLNTLDYYPLLNNKNIKPKKYCFLYLLDSSNNTLKFNIINIFKEIFNQPVMTCYPNSFSNNMKNDGFDDPGKWLSKLEKSNIVITDSFHGIVFSIIFQRPFIAVLRQNAEKELNFRISTILEAVGLESRILLKFNQKVFTKLCESEIDWNSVSKKVDKYAQKGKHYLKKALS